MRTWIRPLSFALALPLLATSIGLAPPDGTSPRVLLTAPWGTAPGAFGIEDHGARPGPSALVATGERVYVLDRVAGRVQVFDRDGERKGVLETGSRTVDMLAVDGAGAVLVLDAFVRREVRVLRSGEEPQIVPLPKNGRMLPSGVFADRDRFWIEWQHGAATAVTCAGLRAASPRDPATADLSPGRPTAKGWVRASRSRAGIVLELGAGSAPRPRTLVLQDPGGVQEIVSLESDAAGRIAVAWVSADDPERRLQVALVGDDGEVLSRLAVPDGSITDLYQRLSLAPDGRLFQLRTGKEGVQIVEWTWPAPESAKGGAR